MSELLNTAFDYFLESKKYADLHALIAETKKLLKDGQPMDIIHRRLMAFVFFIYAMHIGPSIHNEVIAAVFVLDITDYFNNYASNWIDYCHTKKN